MSHKNTLFPLPELPERAESANNHHGKPRLKFAVRNQIEMVMKSLDELLPANHLARDIWRYVEGLDLSKSIWKIQSVAGDAGRPATDPKILLSLWLFATIKGIGSARMINEYCKEHDAYKWLCGGVNVNYHTLSDFRNNQVELFNELLIQSVAVLSKANVISLEKVSQDGMKVRACAGSSSFRRETTIRDQLELAKLLVNDLKEESEKNPNACKERALAAQLRMAEEKKQNLENALKELEKLKTDKAASAKRDRKKLSEKDLNKVRCSITDPEARVMKMACGGFRPAFNVQFASTNMGKAIIAVDVLNIGNDKNQVCAMIQRIKEQYDVIPKKYFVDAGYRSVDELERIAEKYESCEIYMPAIEEEVLKKRKRKETKAEIELRERMATQESKELYRERASTAEYVNAQSRNKGLQQFLATGLQKVTSVVLLFAIVHNATIIIKNQLFA